MISRRDGECGKSLVADNIFCSFLPVIETVQRNVGAGTTFGVISSKISMLSVVQQCIKLPVMIVLMTVMAGGLAAVFTCRKALFDNAVLVIAAAGGFFFLGVRCSFEFAIGSQVKPQVLVYLYLRLGSIRYGSPIGPLRRFGSCFALSMVATRKVDKVGKLKVSTAVLELLASSVAIMVAATNGRLCLGCTPVFSPVELWQTAAHFKHHI